MLLGTRTIIDEVCLSTSVNDRNCEEGNSVVEFYSVMNYSSGKVALPSLVTTFTNLTLPCKRTYFSLSRKCSNSSYLLCSVAVTLRRCVMKLRLLRI